MSVKRVLSILLAMTLILGCGRWVPVSAQQAQTQAAQDIGAPSVMEDTQNEPLTEDHQILNDTKFKHFDEPEHLIRLPEEERINSHVYLNRDGTKTMYVYDHPVQYRDDQGKIQDISLDIADTGDVEYPFRTKANSVVTTFPAMLTEGIMLSGNGVNLRLAAQMPSGNVVVNNGAHRLDAQTIAYTYDANTTIEYALTYTGFKEDIVVSSYTGQTEYGFILYTDGLALTNLDGSYYLTDETGDIQASIGDVIVFTADERNNTFGEMRATTIKPNQIYAMTIVLDAEYLADPKTVYPIRIDPTVSLTYADNGADAIADVTLQSANTSGGERTALVAGLRPYGISRILMKFPGIDFSEYEGVTITSATVSLRDIMCEDTEMMLSCYPFTGDAWEESTATWEGMNQSWGTLLDSHVISYYAEDGTASTHWYAFDISAAVQAWVDGDTTITPEKGLIFKADSAVENDTAQESRTFGSFERTNHKPVFSMTYQSAITLNHSSAELYVGDTLPLTATTAPAGQAVTWHSDNATVASVDDNGVVTGLSEGTSTITAALADGTSAQCSIVVKERAKVTLSQSTVYIAEGSTIALTATVEPPISTVTWASSNPAIATVTDSGLVTGLRAGKTTISATLEDGTYATCVINVTIPNGVYYIRNTFSLYLNVTDGGIANNTAVCQQDLHESDAGDLQKIRQMWKICHLGNGQYSIRPLHKMDMGLHATGDNVDIYQIGTTDTIDEIPDAAKWTIEWRDSGYVIKNSGKPGLFPRSTLKISNNSSNPGETAILAPDYGMEMFLKWSLIEIKTPPIGMIVYDTISGTPMTTVNLDVAVNNTKKLKNLGFEISTYPQIYYDGMLTWDSVYDNVEINENTNSIKGIRVGQDTIIASGNIEGLPVSLSIAVTVIPIETGTYFLVNKSLSKYVYAQPYTSGYSDLLGWEDFAGANRQKWVFTYIGDGMYTIHSRNYTDEYTDNHYLCIREGYTSNNPEVALHPGPVTDYMIWRIELTEGGDYRIIPKTGMSSGSVLSITSTAPFKVIHTTYTEDERYRCEWQIYKNDNIAFLLGIDDKNPDHNHSSTHYEIESNLRNKGYTDIYRVITSEMSKQDVLTNLEMCEIFVFRGHGNVTGEGESYIVTDKAQTIKVKAGDIYDYANGVARVDLSGCEILLFVACYTASGSQNIAEAAVLAGAKFAIGFNDEISCASAHIFVKSFVEYLAEGTSHRYAAEQAAFKAGLREYLVYYPEFGGLL